MSTKDLISEASSTLGGGHYDHDKSDFLAMMERMGTHSSSLVTYFCEVSQMTRTLGEWVLSELKRRGLIIA